MLRRWDLVALVALVLVPFAALVALAIEGADVTSVVSELERHMVELQRKSPTTEAWDLEPLTALGGKPFSDETRADIDSVLAGTKPPWEVSPSTSELLAEYEIALQPLAASVSLPTTSRPLINSEYRGATDLGRGLAFFAVNTRSRGLNTVADTNCSTGYSLAQKLVAGGALDEAYVAAELFRTVHAACGESLGTASRAARLAALENVLALSSRTTRTLDILERDRVWRLLRLYRRGIGDIPPELVSRLPPTWKLDPEMTTHEQFLSRSWAGLGLRAVLAAASESIAQERAGRRAPPAAMPAPFERSLSFRDAVTAARAAEDYERAAWRVLAARLVAEIFVIDHQRWPKDASELHLDDDALDAKVQALMRPDSLVLLEHDAYLSLILDGKYNIRAMLPDDLAHLAKAPSPARDFTGRLIERAAPPER